MKANLLILLTFAALPSAFAETQHALRNQGLSARPDIPGHFVIDLGISNFYLNTPSTEIGGWSSRTINAYYFYEFKLGDSRFSFRPGLGAGMDRYSFTNNKILAQAKANDGSRVIVQDNIYHNNLADTILRGNIDYSKLVANYLDIPLELSYHFNKSDFNKSIRITAGAKLGLLFDSKNKYKYSYEGDTRTVKNKMDLQLSPFRFGVYGE